MWRTFAIIPRISGRSSLTTAWRMRLSPRARIVSRCRRVVPMTLRTCVTLSLAIATLDLGALLFRPVPGFRHGLEHRAGSHLRDVLAPETGHVLRPAQSSQTRHGRVHDVDRIVG